MSLRRKVKDEEYPDDEPTEVDLVLFIERINLEDLEDEEEEEGED